MRISGKIHPKSYIKLLTHPNKLVLNKMLLKIRPSSFSKTRKQNKPNQRLAKSIRDIIHKEQSANKKEKTTISKQ